MFNNELEELKMKAYVVVYGYSDEYEIHSVFMNKEGSRSVL